MRIREIRETHGLALKLAVLSLCSLWALAVRAQVEIPDTPAGRVLEAWLEAFNSGDGDLIDAYIEAHQPDRTLEQTLAFRTQTGGFDLLSIESSEPLSIAFVVQERASDMRAIGMLGVEDIEPARVTSFMLRANPGGGEIAGFTIDGATREAVIDGAIEKLREFYVFPDTAEAMAEALRERQRRGEYADVTNGATFAQLLTEHLREVSHDRHLGVNFSPVALPARPPEPTPEMRERNRAQITRMNCGFEKIEHLSGNVGYLKFNVRSRAPRSSPIT